MKTTRRKIFCATITIGAVIIVILAGTAAYYYSQQKDFNSAVDVVETKEDNVVVIKAEKVLRTMQEYFPDFMNEGALTGINFCRNKDEEYMGRTLFDSSRAEFVKVRKLKDILLQMLKRGRLFVHDDKAGFFVDCLNEIDWEAQNEVIRTAIFKKNDLTPAKISEENAGQDIMTALIAILKQEKQYDAWGFIRFFFMTSVENVYLVAVCSMDENNYAFVRPLTYIAIPKSYSIDSISRVNEGFIERLLSHIDFDDELKVIEFSLDNSEKSLRDDIDTCLDIFIGQLMREEIAQE